MDYFVGLDVSLKEAAVCILDASGQVICEEKVASEPDVLTVFLRGLGFEVSRIGLEAGPLSQWLFAGLSAAGFEVVLLETRHVKAALSAMTAKTDRLDASGIAHLLRMGWYRPVHCKALASKDVRSLLTARKLLLGKLIDVEVGIRGILRGFGLKIGTVTRKMFELRVRELVEGQQTLTTIASAMLAARALLMQEVAGLHKALLRIAREDKTTGRLMSVPGACGRDRRTSHPPHAPAGCQ